MNYTDFQHLARLFVMGALDHDELEAFTTGRLLFGKRAEAYLRKCRDLGTLLALALEPMTARPESKAQLMQSIRQQLPLRSDPRRTAPGAGRDGADGPSDHQAGNADSTDPFEAPLHYEASCRN